MLDTVKKWVPITHSAFLDYREKMFVSAKVKEFNLGKGEKFLKVCIRRENGMN